MRNIDTTSAEMNLPDAPDVDYFNADTYLRRYLASVGDTRWKLPSPDFEQEFYQHTNNDMRLNDLLSAAPLNAFESFSDYDPNGPNLPGATSIAPAAGNSNAFTNALSGVIQAAGTAAASRIAPKPGVNKTVAPALAPKPAATNWTPIIIGGVAVIALLAVVSQAGKRR